MTIEPKELGFAEAALSAAAQVEARLATVQGEKEVLARALATARRRPVLSMSDAISVVSIEPVASGAGANSGRRRPVLTLSDSVTLVSIPPSEAAADSGADAGEGTGGGGSRRCRPVLSMSSTMNVVSIPPTVTAADTASSLGPSPSAHEELTAETAEEKEPVPEGGRGASVGHHPTSLLSLGLRLTDTDMAFVVTAQGARRHCCTTSTRAPRSRRSARCWSRP